ncbi:MAG: hypothetical protein WCP70_14720 [Methanothrix sp.]
MKIIAVFAALIFLISPALAWEINNGTVTMPEYELLEALTIAKNAGMCQTTGNFATNQYNAGFLAYTDYSTYLTSYNKAIRRWNNLLDEYFLFTVANENKMEEFKV